MKKILVIIKREYKTRVAKRSFLLLTILVPIFIFGFYALIIVIGMSGSSVHEKIAVIDEAGVFKKGSDSSDGIVFNVIQNETEKDYLSKYDKEGYSSLLYLPADSGKKDLAFYTQSQIGLQTKGQIEKLINDKIEANRMEQYHISPEQMRNVKSNLSIRVQKMKGNKFEDKSVEAAAIVGGVAGFMLYITMFIYGMMVMRGITEEKLSRISEVIISSVRPFQLMIGKIVGIAAVGITQFIIWIVLIYTLYLLLPFVSPQLAANSSQVPVAGTLAAFMKALGSLNFSLIIFAFLFYFIGGYLLYSSLFAAVGSVVSEDQQEAQQLTLPITMPIILSFVIMTKAVTDPNSGLAVFGSLFPLTSPIVMMGRIGYGVPAWQLLLSMALLVLGFLFTTWMAGKIYRTGILLYGKKASWKEMIKWAFRKS